MISRADDLMCSRFHALAWAAWVHAPPAARLRTVPPLGSFVVVIDGCIRGGHPRDAVGELVGYRPPVSKGRGRCVELYTIRTPRGVVKRWTNCTLFVVPERPDA